MKKSLFTLLVITLTITAQLKSQERSILGFWEIEEVVVGEQKMTPVAKWTKINNDSTFQSGNGWLQSSAGTWKYDARTKTFTSIDELGMIDEYGGFHVDIVKEKMIWKRQEDGMEVKVTFKSISKLPMSPADYLEGMWQITDISKNELSTIAEEDPEKKHKLHIRWDRIYSSYTPEGSRLTGYWHIHGHRPEITMLPHQNGLSAESWKISVDKTDLILTGISDSNNGIVKTYKRKNTF